MDETGGARFDGAAWARRLADVDCSGLPDAPPAADEARESLSRGAAGAYAQHDALERVLAAQVVARRACLALPPVARHPRLDAVARVIAANRAARRPACAPEETLLALLARVGIDGREADFLANHLDGLFFADDPGLVDRWARHAEALACFDAPTLRWFGMGVSSVDGRTGLAFLFLRRAAAVPRAAAPPAAPPAAPRGPWWRRPRGG